MALVGLGLVDAVAGAHEPAARELDEALALFRRAGDRWGMTSSLWRRADHATIRGDFAEAEAALGEALLVLGETRRTRWIAHTTANHAEVLLAAGDVEGAAKRFGEARTLYETARDTLGVARLDARTAVVLDPR
jgi:tetratricopeptide (TPR) repeat protein